MLISKEKVVSSAFTKLKEDFDLDYTTVPKAFLNLKTANFKFKFKFLVDIICTNVRLAKIGYVRNDTCTFCEIDSETVLHLFYECPFTNLFFKKSWILLICSLKKARRAFATRRVHWEVREKWFIELFQNPCKIAYLVKPAFCQKCQ